MYVNGKNILDIISDSINTNIANKAWVLVGNVAPANNKLGTLNATDLHIVTGGADKITILNGTGNVGIGQSLPTEKLDVVGNIRATGGSLLFDKELKPAGLPGNTGDILVSQGAGAAPQWISSTTPISGTGTTTPLITLNGIGDIAHKNSITQGVILVAPNNTCWKLTVGNTGNIITQSVTCP
jgi:hypothetical protein